MAQRGYITNRFIPNSLQKLVIVKWKYLFIFFALSFLIKTPVLGSKIDSLAEKKIYIGLTPNLSFTGINTSVIVGMKTKSFLFFGGTKIVMEDSFFPNDLVLGPELGIAYLFKQGKKSGVFALLNYQSVFYKPTSRFIDSGGKKNSVHEFTFSYGVKFNLNNRLWIDNSIGVGGYLNRTHDLVEETVNCSLSTSGLLRIGIFYQLF